MERDRNTGKSRINFKKRQPEPKQEPAPPTPAKSIESQPAKPRSIREAWSLYRSLPPGPARIKMLRKLFDFFNRKTDGKRIDKANWDAMEDMIVYIWAAYSQMEGEERRICRDGLYVHYWDDCERSVRSFFRRKVPTHSLVEEDDIAQGVSLRLVQAIDKYDQSRGMKFMQYFNAKFGSQLKGGMIDSLRDLQEFPRVTALNKRRLREKWGLLRQLIGREPKPEDYLDVFGWDKLEELRDSLLFANVFNQQQGGGSEGDDDTGDDFRFSEASMAKLDSDKPLRQEEALDNEQRILGLIEDKLVRRAVWCYYWCEMTSVEIAEDQECSKSTAYERVLAGKNIILECFTRNSYLKWVGREVDQ